MLRLLLSVSHRRGLPAFVCALVIAVGAPSAFPDEPKPRTYPLALSPLEIHARLSELNMGTPPRIGEDERTLLATVWERKSKDPAEPVRIDDAMLLDAVLLASGIEEPDARRAYREKFDKVLAGAQAAVKDAKDPRERGEKLMRYLHGGVMNKGYESGQTSFAAIFDTGKYNCVSSTAMYYLVGSRLGLNLRPMSIPGSAAVAGHASLDLVEGDQFIQVEPTNPDGFDWQAKVNRPGVTVIGHIPDRKNGHPIDAPGIATMIYSNRGVELSNKKSPQRLQAARCYLAALALDPVDETASNNVQSLFVNWGPELLAEKKFEEAVRVLAFGAIMAPASDAIKNNTRVAWSAHIENALKAGLNKDALALIDRAAKAVPDDSDFQSASHWIIRHGETLAKESGWDAGLAVAEPATKMLSEDDCKKILEWRTSLFRRWSQSLLQKGDADESKNVLARAYALNAQDPEIIEGIGFHTQEALKLLDAKSGPAATIQHFAALQKQFPNLEQVSEGGARHVGRVIQKLAHDKKFKEAIAAVEQYGPLFTTPEARAEAGGDAYDSWARDLARGKDFQAALDKYAEGLKAFPEHKRLLGNGVATVDQWASTAMKAKNWDEAIRIYTIGLTIFPDNSHLRHNKEVCEKRKR
jgi:tetratricopeptide (TPR) repeat protein